jgi:hypothetical protein
VLGFALFAVVARDVVACDGEDAPPVVKVHDDITGPVATVMPSTEAPLSTGTPDASTDSPYGVDDGGYAQGYAVSPLTVCKQCACEAGTYCFGGGTGYTTFSGTCTSGPPLGIGCQPLPAACATKPDCACLFDSLKGQVPCYLVCSGVDNLLAYCPSP